ncbi:MAG: diguanylate cyclase [Candidatus Izemoplasmatales bacterium]|nr:diguanylate cyclase [Candidatus Izemoplasmatales bacterium]
MRYDVLLNGITLTMAVLSLLVALYIFVYVRKMKGTLFIGVLFILEFIYAAGYALEGMSSTLEAKVLFNHIQYIAVPFIAIQWVYIAKRYENLNYRPKLIHYLPFLIVPFTVFLAVQLTYVTDLSIYYKSMFLDQNFVFIGTSYPVLAMEKGWLYYVNTSHNLLLVSYVLWIYIRTYRNTTGIHKQRALILAICSFLGAIAGGITYFSTITTGIDLALYLILCVGYVILYAMFRYELFDLTPSAHKATFELATDPIMTLDDKYEIVEWNHAALRHASSDRPLGYHMKLEEAFSDTGIPEAVRIGKPYSFKIDEKHYILETIPLTTKRGLKTGYLLKFHDMTSYMEKMEELDYQATHDELTKAYNRRAFLDLSSQFLSQARKSGESFALYMIDLDDFKYVNDTFGHTIGDFVLEDLTKLIQSKLDEHSIFSRYGGEEFVILIPDCASEKAVSKGEEIRNFIASHDFNYGTIHLNIRISLGVICNHATDLCQISEYIEAADKALYESKRTGKNRLTLYSKTLQCDIHQ